MDLIFNELSLLHKADSVYGAQELMENLLHACKSARKAAKNDNFRRLRVGQNFMQASLSEDYTINDWLNDGAINHTLKTLLLGLKRYPFIAETDENIENKFIQNYYYLREPENKSLHKKLAEGLAAAFLYNTLSISFATHEAWTKTEIELIEKTETEEENVKVRHISRPEHIAFHQGWIDAGRPVKLLKTDIPAREKTINLRDDHGKDVLERFSKKLIYSPYVVKVINSLPFNPKERKFIRNISPDGKIELVLTRTDRGLGLIVQTTGRNLRETREIAKRIETKYR